MSDPNILDRALGLISNFQQARTQKRNELMESILPDVLLPDETKQAALKEETQKSLHAKKYDRRMKFNTALERSQNKATSEELVHPKEDPDWMKEAVEKIAVSEGLAIRALTRATEGATDAESAFQALNKYPRINLRAQGVADPAIRREALPHFKEYTEAASQIADPAALTPEMSEDILSRLFSSQNRLSEILGKQAGDPVFDGVTGREGVITVEDELEKTPPLPIDDPLEYDIGNKPVMAKCSAAADYYPLAYDPMPEESFTQKHPGILPALLGLGGAAALSIPASILGGRSSVSMLRQYRAKELKDAMDLAEKASKAARTATSKRRTVSDKEWKDLVHQARKSKEQLTELQKNKPDYQLAERTGRVGGGLLGGTTGVGLGMQGGLALNKPQSWEQ
jgi:hypothetical protein